MSTRRALMISLPIDYKEKIINRYEDKGKEWLDSIDLIIEKYKSKFGLKQIELANNLTINILIYAKSTVYGDVVLKINSPGKSSICEMMYMKNHFSDYLPKLYYCNLDDRVMLLERLLPGYPLSKLDNQEERVKIFCDILNNTKVGVEGKSNFRYYEDKLNENFKEVYENQELYNNITDMVNKSITFNNEIKKLDLPKFVLHDDLHHKNILKSGNRWKIIDPHGIIGERVIETAQFIRAELEKENGNINKLSEIVNLIGKYIDEDVELIYKVLYINIVSKLIFYIKSGYDKKVITYNIEVCNKILEYI